MLPDFVKEQKRKFKSNNVVDIASPRSANNIDKFLIEKADGSITHGKKTPIAVRAAIVYNNLIRKGMTGFPEINSGDKIKYVYLRQPNNYDENVIGFMRRIPEDAIKYVDWDLQFEKTFMSVITNIYRKMGMVFQMHRETKLSDIF